MVYQPEEDSFLLSECIKNFLKKENNKSTINALDMGSGSGIQAKTIIDYGIPKENLVLVDIDKETIRHLKNKFRKSNVVESNLFSKINKQSKFDFIVFNPPYLPYDKFDKKRDTSGGKKGDEIIIEFLKQAKKHLSKNGKILLLVSSYTPKIDFNKLGYKKIIVERKKLFFEELIVVELSKIDKNL